MHIAKIGNQGLNPDSYAAVCRYFFPRAIPKAVTVELSDRKSTRLNSSHSGESRMPSSA